MSSATYCHHAFKRLTMKKYDGDRLLAVAPCCNMSNLVGSVEGQQIGIHIPDLETLTPEQIFNHPELESLRQNLRNGVRDSRCAVCWRQEDLGLQSYRQNNISGPHAQDGIADLTEVDLLTSAMSNLRCRMCEPASSHSLLIDNKFFVENDLSEQVSYGMGRWLTQQRQPDPARNTPQWNWLMANTHRIKRIRASGGEPFYDHRLIALLERYIARDHAKDTVLNFHTNGTVMHDQMLDLLRHFKENLHDISVDGTGTVYEYIRYPQSWTDLDASIRRYLRKLQLDQVSLTMVVSALNVLNVAEYVTWAGSLTERVWLHFDEIMPVTRGTALRHLPRHLLEIAKDRIEHLALPSTLADETRVANVIAQIDLAIRSNHPDRQRMLTEIGLFDRSRTQHYRDHLDPMLVQWLDRG